MPKVGLILLLALAAPLQSNEGGRAQLHDLQVVGEARLSYLFWTLYDITLLAPSPEFTAEPPFALRIRYTRPFRGGTIADYSSQLIREQGMDDEMRLAGWHAQMDAIFPDVQAGEALTGYYTADRETLFYLGQEEIGRIRDPLFGQYFFNIWLGEQSRDGRLRSKLTGGIREG